jgi:hypothetical protein
MISQFNPCERQFVLMAHEDTLDRIYTINSIRTHSLKSKFLLTPFIVKDTTKIDHFSLMKKQTNGYLYIYTKVTQWLEHLDCDLQTKKINNTIDQDIDFGQHYAGDQNNSL